jgi:hypothetical protein
MGPPPAAARAIARAKGGRVGMMAPMIAGWRSQVWKKSA